VRRPVLVLGIIVAACAHAEQPEHAAGRALTHLPLAWQLPRPSLTSEPVASFAVLLPEATAPRRNIQLAARALNGVSVGVDAEASFNRLVGERTEENGFVKATTLFMGVERADWGGGVCMVSSALFGALRFGGYEVTERHPHSRPRDYMPIGLDAAVNYPDLDLKFRNSRGRPMTLHTRMDEDVLLVSIESDVLPVSASTDWVPRPIVPPKTTEYRSAYVRKPSLHQAGEVGTPGDRTWRYSPAGVVLSVVDRSDYRPIDQIVLVPSAGD